MFLLVAFVLLVGFTTSQTYAPQKVNCPPTLPWILSDAASLDQTRPNEAKWLEARRSKVITSYIAYLTQSNLLNIDISSLENDMKTTHPRIALALSGGGLRSMLVGAGVLDAFDNRSSEARKAKTGGILQLLSYISGVSGSAWLVGSLYSTGEFQTVPYLKNSLWKLDQGLLRPSSSTLGSIREIVRFRRQTDQKDEAGFEETLTDLWGRLLSVHFTNSRDNGIDQTWSDFANYGFLKDGQAPLPIISATQTEAVRDRAFDPRWEITPFYIGANVDNQSFRIETKYLGSQGTSCVEKMDNYGYLLAASSAAFAVETRLEALVSNEEQVGEEVDIKESEAARATQNDRSAIIPNPFANVPFPAAFSQPQISDDETIGLADGASSDLGLPLWTLLNPVRQVDVIFIVDASANTEENWPDGSGIVQARNYAEEYGLNFSTPVPETVDDFYQEFQGTPLTQRISFFGCPSSIIGDAELSSDIVAMNSTILVYIPNREITHRTNDPYTKLDYSGEEQDAYIANGFNMVTGRGTDQEDAPKCISCVLLVAVYSQLQRPISSLPPECITCFQNYCWQQ